MAIIKVKTGGVDSTTNLGRRNLIINGAMQVAQRGTSKTATSSSTYLLDRFMAYAGDAVNYGYTVSQTTDAPAGFSNSLKYNFDVVDTSPATEHSIYYRFEGQDLQHLKKGTLDAESVTLSFWCKASLAGTYIAELMDTDNSNRHINKSYSISSANTWEYKTITFEGDTTGALTNDNSTSIDIAFWLAAHSSNTSGTLQTSWGALTQANRAVGQTNLGATVNNAFYITGVQLEVGNTDTPFEHRSFAEELQSCYRYYRVIGPYGDPFQTVGVGYFLGHTGSGMQNNENRVAVPYLETTMRTTPAVTHVNFLNGGTGALTEFSSNTIRSQTGIWDVTPNGGGYAQFNGNFTNPVRYRAIFDAEL